MLKLWGRPTSARTQKVLWTLAEIGMDFEFILASATMGPGGHVSRGHRPFGVVDTPAYLALNPTGKVPMIDDEGFILWESGSIVRYLAMQYARERLYGADIRTFASASRWLDWENNELLPPQHEMVMQLVRLPAGERDAAKQAAACEAFASALQIAEAQLARTRYIAGERFTFGDIPLGIRVHRWYLFDIRRPEMPNIRRWHGEIRDRPGFQKWTADPAHHVEG
jgi:glutathione S-transferase